MIQIDQLSKKYRRGSWALQDVNLTLNEGMIGLLGPNGAGKSSLMRILATLVTPTIGEAYIHGIPLSKAEEIRQLLGYLPQQFQVYPQLTGREYLDYVATMKGIKDSKMRKTEVERLLEEVNLTDKADKKVRTYSGGMKRRLGIAQALTGSPSVLIVDEPTAGLDPEERVRFRNSLTRFSLGRIVLLSTHIVADIESNCRQIAVLDKGRVKLSGQLPDLQKRGEGQVWEGIVTDQEYAGLDPMSIVSTRRTDDGLLCRIIGEEPPHGIDAISVSPTLEDGYMVLLRSSLEEDCWT
ncbi:ABC-type multidrug transport system, ATPase component [Fontibacillus panacisegetis]|uniref:ABC-type multidrug transport system, ATPase component n=1 Tax=Fontibacillus panacisegetis TaxID=670482 RepID=A0A1G7H7A2_9BACL|nr:ABC transporter ATP-binding protein [Fontibacillus panacisegetis]SDE96298.1 ABC-type multidrug transport system, ATPase component [Fontibacillus panacisegetis]